MMDLIAAYHSVSFLFPLTVFFVAVFLLSLKKKSTERESGSVMRREPSRFGGASLVLLCITLGCGVKLNDRLIALESFNQTRAQQVRGLLRQTQQKPATRGLTQTLAGLSANYPSTKLSIVKFAFSQQVKTIRKEDFLFSELVKMAEDSDLSAEEVMQWQTIYSHRERFSILDMQKHLEQAQKVPGRLQPARTHKASSPKLKVENNPREDLQQIAADKYPPLPFSQEEWRRVSVGFSAIGLQYTPFNPAPGRLSAVEKAYLQTLFHWCDLAGANRAFVLFWFESRGKSGESFSVYLGKIDVVKIQLGALSPLPGLEEIQQSIELTIDYQIQFYTAWDQYINTTSSTADKERLSKQMRTLMAMSQLKLTWLKTQLLSRYPQLNYTDEKAINNRIDILKIYTKSATSRTSQRMRSMILV